MTERSNIAMDVTTRISCKSPVWGILSRFNRLFLRRPDLCFLQYYSLSYLLPVTVTWPYSPDIQLYIKFDYRLWTPQQVSHEHTYQSCLKVQSNRCKEQKLDSRSNQLNSPKLSEIIQLLGLTHKLYLTTQQTHCSIISIHEQLCFGQTPL